MEWYKIQISEILDMNKEGEWDKERFITYYIVDDLLEDIISGILKNHAKI